MFDFIFLFIVENIKVVLTTSFFYLRFKWYWIQTLNKLQELLLLWILILPDYRVKTEQIANFFPPSSNKLQSFRHQVTLGKIRKHP